MIHEPVFCREEAGEGCNLRKSLSQMPAGESGNFFAAFLHLLPVLLLFFCLHQRSKQQKDAEGCNLRKSLSQMPAGESGNFFAAFLHLLPVLLLFFCLHQRSKQQKDAFAQTFLRPAVAKLLPGVRVAAFDVLVVDAVVAGNDVVCIEYTAHLVVHL